jgi:hypothetical protein
MFQQTINEKINNIHLLVQDDLLLFSDLKKKYPFSEIFQLIYLQLVKKYDPISFEEELSKVAYKIRDRHKMIELLNEKTSIKNKEDIIIEKPSENLETIEEKTIQEEPDITKEKVSTNDQINLKNDNDIDTENLNTQIAAEALSSIFSKDFEPTIQFQIDDEKHDIEESFTTLNNQALIEKSIQVQSQKSFTNWLKSGKKEIKQDKNQIIDTIISTNPTISRPKKEFYSPSKQAIKSVDDEKLVYTETLAKILEMQGNFSKAISAYEQLSLTIPEKKTFFVKKIKVLNEKLNSK